MKALEENWEEDESESDSINEEEDWNEEGDESDDDDFPA